MKLFDEEVLLYWHKADSLQQIRNLVERKRDLFKTLSEEDLKILAKKLQENLNVEDIYRRLRFEINISE